MLAQPRKKVTWTLNPRGKLWSDDKSKFGQKMLEKMGWKEGEGLGKQNDGIKEHIKVKFKQDNEGLGYQPKYDDQWIENNDNYEQILNELAKYHNPVQNGSNQVINLEESSKKHRRIHINKFVKSKNLSKCSEEDLVMIFPKSKKVKRKKHDEHQDDERRDDEEQQETVNSIQTLDSQLSINDYFKMKMFKLKSKSIDSSTDEVPSKKRKKKSKEVEVEANLEAENDFENENNHESESEKLLKKKKKKRRKTQVEVEAENLQIQTNLEVENNFENDLEIESNQESESEMLLKKKKKKKKKER